MDAGLRIDGYDWVGGREAMLRWGPEDGPVVLLALPLFEEANRTRAFGVGVLRTLAGMGIACALPDLPGQGESEAPLETISLLKIQEGYEAAADVFWQQGRPVYGIAIRSGALLDALGLLHGRWYLAPQTGPDLLRELKRVRGAATNELLSDFWFHDADLQEGAAIEVAGNLLSPDLLTDLTVKQPWSSADGGPVRTVRLDHDTKPADRHVSGPALWRRAEPDQDLAFADLIADDIAGWIRTCEG